MLSEVLSPLQQDLKYMHESYPIYIINTCLE